MDEGEGVAGASTGASGCLGDLVSCILGRLGDGTGYATEVSGTDALRADGGGCVGSV
jgi:hypothetical protein